MEITEEKYNLAKKNAFNHFLKNKKTISPLFWEIKIWEPAFNHIEWKNKKHKRNTQESYIRYLCFLHFDYIISNSQLYQDFNEQYEKIRIKKNSKYIYQNKLVKYYWLIAIVNNNKQRVKIVLKKLIDGIKWSMSQLSPYGKLHNSDLNYI